jgi:hypothetical protein
MKRIDFSRVLARTPATSVCIACAILVGCNRAGKQIPNVVPEQNSTEDISQLPPDISLTADEFFKLFSADVDSAFDKYGGKVIEITGVVETYGRNIMDTPYIAIQVTGEPLNGVCGTLDPEPWACVAPGQTVRIKCKWVEKLSRQGILFVITETDVNQRVVVNPKQLAQEFTADAKRAEMKYVHKHLIIGGVIRRIDFDVPGAASVFFEGDDKFQIECNVSWNDKGSAREMKVGQRIKLVGEGATVQKGRIFVRECFAITKDPPMIPTNPELGNRGEAR